MERGQEWEQPSGCFRFLNFKVGPMTGNLKVALCPVTGNHVELSCPEIRTLSTLEQLALVATTHTQASQVLHFPVPQGEQRQGPWDMPKATGNAPTGPISTPCMS